MPSSIARQRPTGAPTAVLVLLGSLALSTATALPAQRLKVGQFAPDFALPALNGDTCRLTRLRGHPVIINFWATWCPPCIKEMPMLGAAYRERRADSLEILAVNGDHEAREKVVRFVTRMNLPFPVLVDEKGMVFERYQSLGVPRTLFVDRAGVVRMTVEGQLSPQQMASGLDSILKAH